MPCLKSFDGCYNNDIENEYDGKRYYEGHGCVGVDEYRDEFEHKRFKLHATVFPDDVDSEEGVCVECETKTRDNGSGDPCPTFGTTFCHS